MARGAPTDWGPGPPSRRAQLRTPAPERIGGWAEPGPRCVALRVRLLICSAAGGGGGGGGSEESGQVRTDWPRFPGLRDLIDISTGPQAPPLCAALPPLGRSSRSALGAQFCPPLRELCRASLPSPSSSLHSPPVLSSPLPSLRPPLTPPLAASAPEAPSQSWTLGNCGSFCSFSFSRLLLLTSLLSSLFLV